MLVLQGDGNLLCLSDHCSQSDWIAYKCHLSALWVETDIVGQVYIDDFVKDIKGCQVISAFHDSWQGPNLFNPWMHLSQRNRSLCKAGWQRSEHFNVLSVVLAQAGNVSKSDAHLYWSNHWWLRVAIPLSESQRSVFFDEVDAVCQAWV